MIRSTANLGWFVAAAPYIAQGVSFAVAVLMGRKGGARRIEATDIVNSLQPALQANVDVYLNRSPRTKSAQAAHLAEFDRAWLYLTSPDGCGTGELGQAGRRCISDRDRGGKHDWWSEYRDPIANDPDVKPDPPLTTQITEQARQVLAPILPEGIGMTTALVAVALIVGGLSLK